MSEFLPEDKLRALYIGAMKENTDLFLERDALRAELARVTAERDELRASFPAFHDALDEYEGKAIAAEARVRELEGPWPTSAESALLKRIAALEGALARAEEETTAQARFTYQNGMEIREETAARIAELEGALEEARKWLVNFPTQEYPSNIRCWRIGVGTFLERLAGTGDAPPAESALLARIAELEGLVWRATRMVTDRERWLNDARAALAAGGPPPREHYTVLWHNAEGQLCSSESSFDDPAVAHEHAMAMGGWVAPSVQYRLTTALPAPAPRTHCAACDEPWPHPGKLCEPRDVDYLNAAPAPAPDTSWCSICGGYCFPSHFEKYPSHLRSPAPPPASSCGCLALGYHGHHAPDCPARCTCAPIWVNDKYLHAPDCPAACTCPETTDGVIRTFHLDSRCPRHPPAACTEVTPGRKYVCATNSHAPDCPARVP